MKARIEAIRKRGVTVELENREYAIKAVGEQATDTLLSELNGIKNIYALRLTNGPITNAGLKHLNSMTSLEVLWIKGCDKITYEGLDSIARLTRLRELDLSDSPANDQTVKVINQCQELTRLRVGGTKITDTGVQALMGQKLKALDLSVTAVTDAGLSKLSTLLSLNVLMLTGCNITDAGLLHLKECRKLEHLDVAETKVSKKGIEMLKKQFPMLTVRESE
ncbi:MAG: hypothetical protein L0241_02020 [Planctomycetia bacterium]|nr:hypothetical protein [Planctomycetia bacterium]